MSDNFSQYNAGRIFIGRLTSREDIIRTVENFCRRHGIKLAAFSVTGAVSLFTIGVFDQKQQVHVTSRNEIPMEIISCTGNITLYGENAHVKAQIILADQLGKTSGGCLFPIPFYLTENCSSLNFWDLPQAGCMIRIQAGCCGLQKN